MPIIKRTVSRSLADRTFIVARLQLGIAPEGERFTEAGLSPLFSTTCLIYKPRRNASGATRRKMGREADRVGADTDAIVGAFPHLEPITDLHMSDPDGVPLHAEANGWYWYSSYDGQGTHGATGRTDYEVACDLLRIPRGEIPSGLDREAFTELVNSQRERWACEAAEARTLLESLPEEPAR